MIVGAPERRHGGVNGLWRVRTDAGGVFAVHAMHPRPGLAERTEAVLAVERAAMDAGVSVARPVGATDVAGVTVVVHEWVDAEPVDVDRSPPSLYAGLGRSLARLHGLGLTWPAALADDALDVRPGEADWLELADAARARGLGWSDAIAGGATDLVRALDTLDRWDAVADAAEPTVVGHRDLTSQNVLDRDGTPVLIDWEDAGPITAGAELGRTALDNLGRAGVLDDDLLLAFLRGYAGERPLPPVGRHWCSLWIRGLVVFADHCARSCVEGTAEPSLLRFQTEVLHATVPELRRRFAIATDLVRQFEKASRTIS